MSGIDDGNIDEGILDQIISLVYGHTRITMASSQKSLLQGRLRRRIKKLELSSYQEYIDYLKHNQSETQEFINTVTTNETFFFRTDSVWEYFSKTFLPEWANKNPNKTLKIWSGASSTGEEIYSIAMTCENFSTLNKSFQYNIIGTDISTKVLEMARKGEYTGRPIEKLEKSHPLLLKKYLKKNGDSYTIVPEITQKVNFFQHNLFNTLDAQYEFDIIFLRNVLIYFTKEDQEKVLKNLCKSLKPQGILIIGESESLNNLDSDFEYLQRLIYQRGSPS